ncbi:MAG: hypothetical protein KAJ51_14045, partial [Thermoplasmata archaeon]|nr:hypothetical protein [Thermoplasmata archaeon]
MKNCIKCGSEINNDAIFCIKCDTKQNIESYNEDRESEVEAEEDWELEGEWEWEEDWEKEQRPSQESGQPTQVPPQQPVTYQ